jgi:hypothetical protein
MGISQRGLFIIEPSPIEWYISHHDYKLLALSFNHINRDRVIFEPGDSLAEILMAIKQPVKQVCPAFGDMILHEEVNAPLGY